VTLRRVPEDFVLGVATSAYQIEGARHADGKGESIWDRFSDLGRLRDRGDDAIDHFNRWEEDLDLLADRGISAYRFSTAWTRVIPDGDGEVNQKGLDFYRRLITGMRERGITPYLTLFHWDLPQALQDRGGWASRKTVDAFARYAGVMADALGDDVRHWITQNEPWVASMLGHKDGVFAPGIADWPTAVTVAHHLLLSHGQAVGEIRGRASGSLVGIALDCRPVVAASDSEADVAASVHFDGSRNRWFFDPVFGLGYPEDIMRTYHDQGWVEPGIIIDGDLETISAPTDFVGLNYYTTVKVDAGASETIESELEPGVDQPPGFTEMGWKIDAVGLGSYLKHISATYAPASILVTENGASYSDGPDDAGFVDDRRRIAYLEAHIDASIAVREEGVPVDGYFVWSFLDNLEWVHGFSQRFGLVWVDQATGERVPKASFDWYGEVARNSAVSSR